MSVRQLPTGPLSGGERPFLRPRSKVRKWRISAVQAVTPKARLRLNRLLICAWRIEAACKKSDRFPDAQSEPVRSAERSAFLRQENYRQGYALCGSILTHASAPHVASHQLGRPSGLPSPPFTRLPQPTETCC